MATPSQTMDLGASKDHLHDCSQDPSTIVASVAHLKMATMLWHSHGAILPHVFPDIFIPVSAAFGIIFALFLWWRVSHIRVRSGQRQTGEDGRTFLLEEELTGEDSVGCRALPPVWRVLLQRSRPRRRGNPMQWQPSSNPNGI
jgi:hypothetical protein